MYGRKRKQSFGKDKWREGNEEGWGKSKDIAVIAIGYPKAITKCAKDTLICIKQWVAVNQ